MGLNKKIYLLKQRILIIKNDIKKYHLTRIFSMINMWLKGFSYEKYFLYDFKKNNYHDYLNDFDRLKTRYINLPFDDILNNKIIFEKVFSQYIIIPKNYAYITKGMVHPLQDDYLFDRIEDIDILLKKKGTLVVKPVCGGGGRGVKIIELVDDIIYLDKEKINKDSLSQYLLSLDNYLITEFIKQGDFSSRLYSNSTNTMRIIMMRNPHTNKVFIAAGIQRIGHNKSYGKDNFELGGFSAAIDIDSGILSSAVKILPNGKILWTDKHPETNTQIKGTQIPNWDKIKRQLISVMEKLPYIKYIGWDIVLTNEGIVAIEANDHPGLRSIQAHKSLLKDENIKSFYKYYKVI